MTIAVLVILLLASLAGNAAQSIRVREWRNSAICLRREINAMPVPGRSTTAAADNTDWSNYT